MVVVAVVVVVGYLLAAVEEGVLDGRRGVFVRLVGGLVVGAGQEAGGTHVFGDVLRWVTRVEWGGVGTYVPP